MSPEPAAASASPTEVANLLVNLPKELRDFAIRTKFPIGLAATAIKLGTLHRQQVIACLRTLSEMPPYN